jgi:AcrR family transcriptional regulator
MTTTKERERLTRERIIAAALRVMDTDGLEAVSMRRIAREVGVEAMSLYHHVRDKEDVLDGICEAVMREFEYPDDAGDISERLRAGARSYRRILQAHPDVMRLFAERHGPARSSPDSYRPMEFALRLFREAGLSDRDCVQAFHAFGGYIQGFVMMEGGTIGSPEHVNSKQDLAVMLPLDEFPVLAAVSHYFAECDGDEQFEFGMDLMIRGLTAKVAEGSLGDASPAE